MKKILFIFGTRPEAIKVAPVINIFKNDSANIQTLVAVTAQHREMLDQVLSVFEIVPDYDLDLMSKNQTLASLTGKIMKETTDLLTKIQPDFVIVQGDTTTTFAASLAAFYHKVPVAHVEAGLRTRNIYSPFPEEVNRRITSSIASLHFSPTEQAKHNLVNEGFDEQTIKVTGNTVIDALLAVSRKIKSDTSLYEEKLSNEYGINFDTKKMILVTGHRRESFGKPFESICNAIKHVAKNNCVEIVYPVHMNPNIQETANSILSGISNVHLIQPQDYTTFIFLMQKAYLILTDSGGVQEEAPSLGKPVLVLRSTTERQEGVIAGTTRLVGTDCQTIITQVEILLNNKIEYEKMAQAVNPYGDGNASKRIFNSIING